MIVVDTNVVSAVMSDPPDETVVGWMNAQPPGSLWITTISVFEVRFGIFVLPEGRRKQLLEAAFERSLDEDFERRILPFDEQAAFAAAEIAAGRQRAGRPVETKDIQIAGIARDRRAVLATRNTRHFEGFGIKIVNPWTVV